MPKTIAPTRIPALVLAVLISGLILGAPVVRAETSTTLATLSETSWSWMTAALWPFESLSHWVGGLISREEGAAVDEADKFKHNIDTDLSSFEALTRQAGFRLVSVSVGASLAPKIGLALAFERRLSEPEKAALMARITDTSGVVGTIQRSIIMTLLNAAESVYAVRNDGYRLSEVDIDVGLMPNATFILTKKQ